MKTNNENRHVVLFDFDSILYKACFKIVDIPKIKTWFRMGKTKYWMTEEIINLSINRAINIGDNILLDIEDTGVDVYRVEYFLTRCKNSIRKKSYPGYKANRPQNKWVGLIREKLLQIEGYLHDDVWEADDLIKDRAVYYGFDKCVVATMDKDLKQIPGYYFDFYRQHPKDENGKRKLDERGYKIQGACRGIEYITEEQAERFFWEQMLKGDPGDCIKGIPRIGKIKAARILEGVEDFETTVKQQYEKYFGIEEGKRQFELHKLLIGLGVEHRR